MRRLSVHLRMSIRIRHLVDQKRLCDLQLHYRLVRTVIPDLSVLFWHGEKGNWWSTHASVIVNSVLTNIILVDASLTRQ